MEIKCNECGTVITKPKKYYEISDAERGFSSLMDPYFDNIPDYDFKQWRAEHHNFIKDAHLELINQHRKKHEQIIDLENDTKRRIEVIEAEKKEMSEKFYKRLVEDYKAWRKAK